LWTGWRDIPLTDKGRQEAKKAAEAIRDIHFDLFFTSPLSRAVETLEIIEKELGYSGAQNIIDKALNERDYGDFTGKNKWEIEKEVGRERFLAIRRGWDVPIPGGETLKDVYNRVVPYFLSNILPHLKEGKNVLVSAHGNSLRALVKFLENISDEDIQHLEIKTGEVYIYKIDKNGNILNKEIRN
jgi:2,3-bisphosphoglycerate-dependent phosphoglycerate mutase